MASGLSLAGAVLDGIAQGLLANQQQQRQDQLTALQLARQSGQQVLPVSQYQQVPQPFLQRLLGLGGSPFQPQNGQPVFGIGGQGFTVRPQPTLGDSPDLAAALGFTPELLKGGGASRVPLTSDLLEKVAQGNLLQKRTDEAQRAAVIRDAFGALQKLQPQTADDVELVRSLKQKITTPGLSLGDIQALRGQIPEQFDIPVQLADGRTIRVSPQQAQQAEARKIQLEGQQQQRELLGELGRGRLQEQQTNTELRRQQVESEAAKRTADTENVRTAPSRAAATKRLEDANKEAALAQSTHNILDEAERLINSPEGVYGNTPLDRAAMLAYNSGAFRQDDQKAINTARLRQIGSQLVAARGLGAQVSDKDAEYYNRAAGDFARAQNIQQLKTSINSIRTILNRSISNANTLQQTFEDTGRLPAFPERQPTQGAPAGQSSATPQPAQPGAAKRQGNATPQPAQTGTAKARPLQVLIDGFTRTPPDQQRAYLDSLSPAESEALDRFLGLK